MSDDSLKAPGCVVQCLVKWWAEYPGPLLQERVVMPLQQYLTDELFVTKKLTVSVMNVIKVLAKVEEANQLGRQLPPEAFYNELIRSVATSPLPPPPPPPQTCALAFLPFSVVCSVSLSLFDVGICGYAGRPSKCAS